MADLGQMLSQVPAQAAAVNPQTPAEFNKLKQGWTDFANKLRTDNKVRQAVLAFGTNLMQPINPRQQSWSGLFGQALAAGNKAYGAEDASQTAQALANKKVGIAQQEADTAAALAKAKEGYLGRMPAAGKKTSAQVALLDKVTNSIITSMGWDANNAKEQAAATQMALARIKNVQTPADKAKAAVIQATALPGQAEDAITQLDQLNTPSNNLDLLKSIDPQLYQSELAKRGPQFSGYAPPGATPKADASPSAAAWMDLPAGHTDLANGVHIDGKGNKIEVKDGKYREIP